MQLVDVQLNVRILVYQRAVYDTHLGGQDKTPNCSAWHLHRQVL